MKERSKASPMKLGHSSVSVDYGTRGLGKLIPEIGQSCSSPNKCVRVSEGIHILRGVPVEFGFRVGCRYLYGEIRHCNEREWNQIHVGELQRIFFPPLRATL